MTPGMNFTAALPLLILTAAVPLGMLLLIVRRSHELIAGFTAAALGVSLLSVNLALGASSAVFSSLFIFNAYALGFVALILAAGLAVVVLAYTYFQANEDIIREEFYLLILTGILGAVALAAANNLASLFLGLETMTLSLIGMIAYPRRRPESVEAGLKYLILSGVSSAFMLFGMALIYVGRGTLGFDQLLAGHTVTLDDTVMVISGLALMGTASGFKLSLVPFHMWAPDIFAGAPAPAAAFLAVVSKIAVLAVVMRAVGQNGAILDPKIAEIIAGIAVASMLVGNLLALMQENLKRLLAYSSIAHLGYLLVALLVPGSLGRMAVSFYLVMYAISVIGAFGVISILSRGEAARDCDRLDDFQGLFWSRPWLAAIMTFIILSLAGVPPAIGFMAKIYVMASGVSADMKLLTGVLIGTSIIGLYYYLRIIVVMARRQDATIALSGRGEISWLGRVTLVSIGVLTVVFGVDPQPLINLLKALT